MHRVATEVVIAVASATVMASVVLLLVGVSAHPLIAPDDWPLQEPRECVETPVTSVSNSGVEGSVRLCIDRNGVQPVLRIHNLQEGEAYTAWLAYFDRPSLCFAESCNFIDLRGDDPVGVLSRVSGAIAPPARDLELRGDFRGFLPSPGSQVTLLLVSHGSINQNDGRARARQLLTPQMFDLGAPMAGALGDRTRGLLHAQATIIVKGLST